MNATHRPRGLSDIAPELHRILNAGGIPVGRSPADIRCETQWVTMRDGVRLATDIYRPPIEAGPVIAVRTPYGRAQVKFVHAFLAFAERGYIVIAQDCRGTGESEPDVWDYYVYEREDSFDLVSWITQQKWFDGFLGGCGSSYLAQMQWCMALHPGMITIAPEVGGLGIVGHPVRHYMFSNAYSRSVGKGTGKVHISYQDLEREMLAETLAGGYFNDPIQSPVPQELLDYCPAIRTMGPERRTRWIWEHYSSLTPARRRDLLRIAANTNEITATTIDSLTSVFGHQVAHDAHALPYAKQSDLASSVHAIPLLITGWY